MFIFHLLAINLLLWFPETALAYDYCRNQSLKCLSGIRHFSCTGELEPQAIFQTFCPMSQRMRDIVLQNHNWIRDRISSGKEVSLKSNEYYPAASRMREFIWDRELEYVAHLHAATCHFGHSKCHLTTHFPFAGQNIGHSSSNSPKHPDDIFNNSIKAIFLEKDDVDSPLDMARKYLIEEYRGKVGHLTQLLNDRSHRLGCALAMCSDCVGKMGHRKNFCYYMTCQYDISAIHGRFLYKTGKPASNCHDWESARSSKYRNLCKNTGKNFEVEKLFKPEED